MIRPTDVDDIIIRMVAELLEQGADKATLRSLLRWSEWGNSTLDYVFDRAETDPVR